MQVMCRELEYELGPGAEDAFRTYISERMNQPFFSNARTVCVELASPPDRI